MRKIYICLVALFTSLINYSQKINVSYSAGSFSGEFSGRVILYLSKDGKIPKDLGIGLPTLTCFAVDVKNIKPGQSITFDDNAVSYPVKLSEIERGEYYAQAVWDQNLGGRNIGDSPGNIFNTSVQFKFTNDIQKVFNLNCDQTVQSQRFVDSEFTKMLSVPSALLTKFHKRPTAVDAAILLPAEYYEQPQRKFPVHFLISGYGGDFMYYSGRNIKSTPLDKIPCITVYLDGNCATGHSTYANSDNNGPWGDAIVNEFIKALDSKYRTDGG